MLPDMSDTLMEWEIPVLLKTITQQTINFQPADIVTVTPLQAVVQPAQKDRLNPEQIDWSLRYLQIHARQQLGVGQYIEWEGQDYKITEDGDYRLYGFSDVVAEQTKRPVLTATFMLTYTAGANGTITGAEKQVVAIGENATTVTATPAAGYQFVQWSDGVLTASRTDTDVQSTISVTAQFEAIP